MTVSGAALHTGGLELKVRLITEVEEGKKKHSEDCQLIAPLAAVLLYQPRSTKARIYYNDSFLHLRLKRHGSYEAMETGHQHHPASS